MGLKLSGLLIIVGSLLMIVGATFLAAALGQRQDETIVGAGICAFSFGSLLVAGGLYLKARTLQASPALAAASKPQPKPTRGGCDLCGTESPAVLCRTHDVHLCPACLSKHYDKRTCAYAPSIRRAPAAKAARA